jgi:hypothetical protein
MLTHRASAFAQTFEFAKNNNNRNKFIKAHRIANAAEGQSGSEVTIEKRFK